VIPTGEKAVIARQAMAVVVPAKRWLTSRDPSNHDDHTKVK